MDNKKMKWTQDRLLDRINKGFPSDADMIHMIEQHGVRYFNTLVLWTRWINVKGGRNDKCDQSF